MEVYLLRFLETEARLAERTPQDPLHQFARRYRKLATFHLETLEKHSINSATGQGDAVAFVLSGAFFPGGLRRSVFFKLRRYRMVRNH